MFSKYHIPIVYLFSSPHTLAKTPVSVAQSQNICSCACVSLSPQKSPHSTIPGKKKYLQHIANKKIIANNFWCYWWIVFLQSCKNHNTSCLSGDSLWFNERWQESLWRASWRIRKHNQCHDYSKLPTSLTVFTCQVIINNCCYRS